MKPSVDITTVFGFHRLRVIRDKRHLLLEICCFVVCFFVVVVVVFLFLFFVFFFVFFFHL